MDMNGKIALVTGASRGIGAAIAAHLGAAGAIVIGTATSESGAEKISARLKELGINGAGRVLNVTDAESVASLLKSVQDEFGPPSILVNNVRITIDNLLKRMNDDEWFD